ncbi:hypothetical protein BAU15_12865 [Enterococcus sp. JM4C]|uniref:helix-turn-helix transcriptional regulator n=1 Tax=Candidatus Enterococcus huntleyi TaxID=1857217 RepID=UPI00137AC718|nr:WYL domain-containing protein [Enterococcus sp. JM4C]KAF1296441.1 hypothetical protein BAU15_12865 [Enterococcus sp. JM4C]
MKSNERIVNILIRLLNGESLFVEELLTDYQLNRRTLQRDISTIRKTLELHEVDKEIVYNNERKQYYLTYEENEIFTEILFLIKILVGTRALTKEELQKIVDRLLSILSAEDQKRMKALVTSGLINYRHVSHGKTLFPLLQEFTGYVEQKETVDFLYTNSVDGTSKEGYGLPVSIYFADFYIYILMYSEKHQRTHPYRLDRFLTVTPSEKKKIRLDYSEKVEEGVLINKTYLLSGGKELTYTFRYWAFPQTALDKLPNAKVIKKYDDNSVLIEATSFEQGIMFWILGQGTFVQVLSPPSLVKAVKEELNKILHLYE